MTATDTANTVLEVDYESFLIFVNILMDKMAQIAASILVKKSQIPDKSFHEHKKYFLDHNAEFLREGNYVIK